MSLMHNDDDEQEEEERWNRIPYEIECKGQIECYDKISELHPEYPVIIYNYARKYKKRLKKIEAMYAQVQRIRLVGNIHKELFYLIIYIRVLIVIA